MTKLYLQDIEIAKASDIPVIPTLATVATSGSYNDLIDKPSLAAVATSGAYSDLSGTPTLAAVATSGSYADLTNKPTIPSKTSDLQNDSNFVADASYVHTDNNYTTNEKNKLSGIATGAEVNVQANWNETNTASDAYIQNKPTIPDMTHVVQRSDLTAQQYAALTTKDANTIYVVS